VSANDLPFSITAWVKVSGTSDQQHIIGKASANKREYSFYISANTLRLIISNATASTYILATAPFTTTNAWVFVCATYSGSANETGIKLYINGTESQNSQTHSGTYTKMTSGSGLLVVGSLYGTTNFLSGLIDHVRIWNKVLSPTEMGYAMNNVTGW
jgi:hypothetical protein